MKKLSKILGGLLIAFAILMFMYGSIKTSRALEEDENKVQLTEDIVMVEENKNEGIAKNSFMVGGVSLLLGIALISMGRRKE